MPSSFNYRRGKYRLRLLMLKPRNWRPSFDH